MARRPLAALLVPVWLACALAGGGVAANEALPLAADPALEARVMGIAAELRCLVCQNETVAASQSALAQDLRRQIGTRLVAGESPDQIREFMVERYGEFVLYRPAFNGITALLWIGPFMLLAGALWVFRRHLRAGPPADDGLSAEERIRAQRLLDEGGGRT